MADAAAIHRDYYKAFNDHDLARVRDFYHPDYVYTDTDGAEYDIDGDMALNEAYLSAFPDLSFEVLHEHAPSSDVSIMEGVVRGTHKEALSLPGAESIPATGKQSESLACFVIEVRDGKIYRSRSYYDLFSVLQQLGVVPGE